MDDNFDMARFERMVKFDLRFADWYDEIVSFESDIANRRVRVKFKNGKTGEAVYNPDVPGNVEWVGNEIGY